VFSQRVICQEWTRDYTLNNISFLDLRHRDRRNCKYAMDRSENKHIIALQMGMTHFLSLSKRSGKIVWASLQRALKYSWTAGFGSGQTSGDLERVLSWKYQLRFSAGWFYILLSALEVKIIPEAEAPLNGKNGKSHNACIKHRWSTVYLKV